MTDSDVAEFEVPLKFQGKLSGDPQFEGMKRRVTITRAAILKAIDLPLTGGTQDLYDEFFFDIWIRVTSEAWYRRPEGGRLRLNVEDIKVGDRNSE